MQPKDLPAQDPTLTSQQQELPELMQSGLLGGEDKLKTLALTPALLTATNPNEIIKIITSNFPNVRVQYNKDNQGNAFPVLTNSETGASTIINRPGLSTMDIMQTVGIGAALFPFSKAATIPAAIGKSMLGEATLQGVQAASGGEFDPEEVAIGGAASGVAEVGGRLIGGAIRKRAAEAERSLVEAEINVLTGGASQNAQEVAQESLLTDIARAARATTEKQETFLKALPKDINIDPARVEAAKRLGIDEALVPSQLARACKYSGLKAQHLGKRIIHKSFSKG